MIVRQFPTLKTAWHGLIQELLYENREDEYLRWSIGTAFPSPLVVEIDDILSDCNLSLGMTGYSSKRWKTFVRRYLRSDIQSWIGASVKQLLANKGEGMVCGYKTSLSPGAHHQGHYDYGQCLEALHFRFFPSPTTIMYSRTCCLDRAGILDIALLNALARETGMKKMRGVWMLCSAFVSFAGQIFYSARFPRKMRMNHHLDKRIVPLKESKWGVWAKKLERKEEWLKYGRLKDDILIRDLTLDPQLWGKKRLPEEEEEVA